MEALPIFTTKGSERAGKRRKRKIGKSKGRHGYFAPKGPPAGF